MWFLCCDDMGFLCFLLKYFLVFVSFCSISASLHMAFRLIRIGQLKQNSSRNSIDFYHSHNVYLDCTSFCLMYKMNSILQIVTLLVVTVSLIIILELKGWRNYVWDSNIALYSRNYSERSERLQSYYNIKSRIWILSSIRLHEMNSLWCVVILQSRKQ